MEGLTAVYHPNNIMLLHHRKRKKESFCILHILILQWIPCTHQKALKKFEVTITIWTGKAITDKEYLDLLSPLELEIHLYVE